MSAAALTLPSLCARACHLCSLDGHPLQIDRLRGTEPVESIDLSGDRDWRGLRRGLGVASGVVIASLISSNAVAKSLKCAAASLLAAQIVSSR